MQAEVRTFAFQSHSKFHSRLELDLDCDDSSPTPCREFLSPTFRVNEKINKKFVYDTDTQRSTEQNETDSDCRMKKVDPGFEE